jgi:hypothetical protein
MTSQVKITTLPAGLFERACSPYDGLSSSRNPSCFSQARGLTRWVSQGLNPSYERGLTSPRLRGEVGLPKRCEASQGNPGEGAPKTQRGVRCNDDMHPHSRQVIFSLLTPPLVETPPVPFWSS